MWDSGGSYFTCPLRRLLPRKAFRYFIHLNPRLHSYLGFGVVSCACVLLLLCCVVRLGSGGAVVFTSRRVCFCVFVGVFRASRRDRDFAFAQKHLFLLLRLALASGIWSKIVLSFFASVCKNAHRAKMAFPDFGNLPGLLAVSALRPGCLEVP